MPDGMNQGWSEVARDMVAKRADLFAVLVLAGAAHWSLVNTFAAKMAEMNETLRTLVEHCVSK